MYRDILRYYVRLFGPRAVPVMGPILALRLAVVALRR
jgi:hypothetical protein